MNDKIISQEKEIKNHKDKIELLYKQFEGLKERKENYKNSSFPKRIENINHKELETLILQPKKP